MLGHVYTLLAVCLGFVMFRAQDVSAGLSFIGAMFTGFDISAAGTAALRGVLTGEAVFTLIIAALGAVLPLRELRARAGRRRGVEAASYALCLPLLILCMMKLASGGFAPFIYFQF